MGEMFSRAYNITMGLVGYTQYYDSGSELVLTSVNEQWPTSKYFATLAQPGQSFKQVFLNDKLFSIYTIFYNITKKN